MRVFVAAVLGLLITAEAHAASGHLLLYTSQPERVATETVAAFTQHMPGITVDVFRSGTTEIVNKLQAEIMAGDPKPDVLLIADAMTMEQLKQDGRLMPYVGADVAALPPESYDRDRTYFATKLIATGILVNRNAPFVPASWLDLLRPEAKNQVVLPSPLYSGAAAIQMGAIEAAPALGQGYFARLAANGATAVAGNGAVVSAVAGGQKMYGVAVDFMGFAARDKGSPVSFVFPAEGVSTVTEPVAILKTAHDPAAAKAFVDFLLSREGQQLAARQGFLPVRGDVSPPPDFPPRSSIKQLPVDIDAILKGDEAAKQRFADLFGG